MYVFLYFTCVAYAFALNLIIDLGIKIFRKKWIPRFDKTVELKLFLPLWVNDVRDQDWPIKLLLIIKNNDKNY